MPATVGPTRSGGRPGEHSSDPLIRRPVARPGYRVRVTELVGRARELADVEARLAATRGGSGALVLVEGEAGAGKTAFADEVNRRARAAGHATAWGSCLEGEPSAPFRPWLQILRAIGAGGIDLDEPADASVTRYRRFDAVLDALRDRAVGTGLLLVLDDLHDADLGSLRLLQHVASEAADLPLVLLALARAEEAGADRHEMLAAVGRERGAHRIWLGALADEEVAELATRAAVRPLDAATLRAIGERSGGNPLFAMELARLAGSGKRLPRGIRETIGRRLSGFPRAPGPCSGRRPCTGGSSTRLPSPRRGSWPDPRWSRGWVRPWTPECGGGRPAARAAVDVAADPGAHVRRARRGPAGPGRRADGRGPGPGSARRARGGRLLPPHLRRGARAADRRGVRAGGASGARVHRAGPVPGPHLARECAGAHGPDRRGASDVAVARTTPGRVPAARAGVDRGDGRERGRLRRARGPGRGRTRSCCRSPTGR
ncbi:AAA family ATPase [Dactylosporangium sp. CA-139066]|uniref:AAA family ATPase n=1 Tax=Dactylosporangium sp. CA-139066 TaxID=3239930 RepID=UPI003D89F21B